MKWKPLFLRSLANDFWERNPKVKQLRRVTKELLAASPCVIEIGSGFGINSQAVAGDYLGIDVDSRLLNAAADRYPDREFRDVDVFILEKKDGSFHTVLISLFLHEIEDRAAVVAKAARLASHLVVVLDFEPSLGPFFRFRQTLLDVKAIKTYWKFNLAAALEEEGLREKRTFAVNNLFRAWVFEQADSSVEKDEPQP